MLHACCLITIYLCMRHLTCHYAMTVITRSRTMLLFVAFVLACLTSTSLAAKGTHITIYNDSNYTLRLGPALNDKPTYDEGDAVVLAPGQSHSFSGYNSGLRWTDIDGLVENVDVSFTIERHCNQTDTPSIRKDHWIGVAYVQAHNRGTGAAVFKHTSLPLSPSCVRAGDAYVRLSMDCNSYPVKNEFYSCESQYRTPDAGNAQSIDQTTSKGNSIGGWVYRLEDSDDYKEWQLRISKPPKACLACTDAPDECNGQ